MPDYPKIEDNEEQIKLEEERAEKHETDMERVHKNAEENLAALRATDDEHTEEESRSDEYHATPEELRDESTSEQSEDESTSDEQTDESTTEETSETEQTDDTSDSEVDDENALTPAEVRAALHTGWTQEDIDELAEANPGLAKKTCAKALESQNNLSEKFSEVGKTLAAKKDEPAVPETPPATPEPKKSPIDFAAMRTHYEDDPIVDVLEQVVGQSQQQAEELAKLREASASGDAKVDQAAAQENAAISQQIDTFFERPEIAAYKEVYGDVEKGSKDWDNLTGHQQRKRYEVAEKANLILIGAHQQKVEMSIDRAFECAHDLVTKDVREAVIRKQIKAKATKRSKSLTIEPSNTKAVPGTGKKTRAKAEANAEKLLAKLRGK